jgi:serine/threonine-protein kinase
MWAPAQPGADGVHGAPTVALGPEAVGDARGKTRPFRFGLDPTPRVDAPLPAGEILGERYRLVRELGSGGMGRVYEAVHITLGHKVAIKVLRTDRRSAEYQARFRQEAEAASRVGHPAIVSVSDFGGVNEGASYMVMELLRGEPLEDWLERPGRLADALGWLAEVARGLHAAHAAGIVHRDLKPANLFLHRDAAGQVQPKILDFGIAKITTTDHTQIATAAGTVFGTPYYLAPERALGRPLDGRADLYSLGVVLYEVLTGTVPFTDANYMGVLVKHVKLAPLDPRQAAAERAIPDGIAQLAMTLLAKEPGDRLPDAAAVAAAIERCCASEGAAIDRVVTGPRAAGSNDAMPTMGIDEIRERPTAVPGAVAASPIAAAPVAVPSRGVTRALGSNAMRDGLDAGRSRSKVPLVVGLVAIVGGAAGWVVATREPPPVVAPAPTEVAAPAPAPRIEPTPPPVVEAPPPRFEEAVVVEPPAAPPAATAPPVVVKKRKPKPPKPEPATGPGRPPPMK